MALNLGGPFSVAIVMEHDLFFAKMVHFTALHPIARDALWSSRGRKWFKLLPEFLHRAKHAVLGGAGFQVQRLADLFNGTPFHVPHGEGYALGRRKQAQGAGDFALHLIAKQQPVWPRRGGRHLHLAAFSGLRLIDDLVCIFSLHVRLSRVQEVKRAVDGNPVEPGAEVGAKLKTLQAFIGPQKSFLHQFFCILLVSGHAINHTKDAAGMAFDQHAKRVPVAGQNLRHHGCICNFHSNNLDRNQRKRLGFLLLSRAERGNPIAALLLS